MSNVANYLFFSDHLELIRLRNQITHKECELLRIITKNHLATGTTRATQLLEMDYLGSPSTIHATIKRLITKKLLLTSSDSVDNRIKYLVPSPKSLAILDELGHLLNSQLANISSSKLSNNDEKGYSMIEIENLSIQNAA